MKGPEQERELKKYQEVGMGKNWKKKKNKKKKIKRFKHTLRIKGQGDIIHLTENKCLFYELKNKL